MAWEVRTAGADTNSGGFLAGATGSDLSQSDTPSYNAADLAVDAVTNTKVTSATHNFVAADVGNLINISAGASWTVGIYQIVSVAANAATLDRSPAAVGVTGGTYAVGGALLTIAKAAGAMVSGNKIFVKAGAGYTTTATTTLSVTGTPGGGQAFNRLIGYTTTRGDGGRASLTLSTNTGLVALNATGFGWLIENFDINCASLGTSIGIQLSAYSVARNCKVSNFTTKGINTTNSTDVISECEVTGGTSAASAGIAIAANYCSVTQCNIHDNACTGITLTTSCAVVNNRVVNNTGASSDGIQWGAGGHTIIGNTVHGNGRHGLNGAVATVTGLLIRNNILTNNGGWGLQLASSTGMAALPMWDGNAYFGNTSGGRHFMDDTTTNPVDAVNPYTNVLDVILTSSPYVNAAGGDFTLNNLPGAGAAIRDHAAFPSVPGATQLSYGDMGAYQHPDTVKHLRRSFG